MKFSIKEPILLIFDQIEKDDHLERVLFYEENREHIFALTEKKQFYFTYHYILSLFELGKYEHVVSEIDSLIEYVFIHNINYRPIRTFEELLFKKAKAYYHLVKYETAISLSVQLVGMYPEEMEYRKFLERSHRAHLNFKSTGIRLTALILIFFSAIISAILWLVFSNGQETSLIQSFLIIISPCLLALSLLGGAHFYNYLKSIRLTDILIQQKMAERVVRREV